MAVSWDVEGLAELERRLNKLDDAVSKRAMEQAVKFGGDVVKKEAQRLAPRGDRGHLAQNIINTVETDKASGVTTTHTSAAAMIGPSRTAFYGMFSELGTGGNPLQPFLRPALDSRKELAVRAVAKSLRNRLAIHMPRASG